MRKVKPMLPIEFEHITLVPSLDGKDLIPAHQQLAIELHPHVEDWFYDKNTFPGYSKEEIIYIHINHKFSFVCWDNLKQKPIAYIVGETIYGDHENPLILAWNILSLPGYHAQAYMGMYEAINWIFKNTNVYRIESSVPRIFCSKAIYENLGFTEEGVRRNSIIYKGKPVHMDIMGLLKSDWNNERSTCSNKKKQTIQLIRKYLLKRVNKSHGRKEIIIS